MKKIFLFAASLLLIGLISCVSTQTINPAAALIPQEAILYAQIGSMEEFMGGLDAVLQKTGLSVQIGGISIREFLNVSLAASGSGVSLDWLNFTMPVGMALLPPPEGTDTWENIILTIPLNRELLDEGFDTFLEELTADDDINVKQIEDYLILYTNSSMDEMIPPKQGLNPVELDQYDTGSLTFYINFEALEKETGKSLEDWLAELDDILAEKSDAEEWMGEFQQEWMKVYMKPLSELHNVTCSLSLNDMGLLARGDLAFIPNGEFHKMSKSMVSKGAAKEFLKFIPLNSLSSITTGMSYKGMIESFKTFYTDLFAAFGLSESLLDELLAQFEKMYEVMNPGSAVAYDMEINYELLSQISDPTMLAANPEILEKFFNFEMIGVFSLKDKKKYMEVYKSVQLDTIVNQMMEHTLALVGEENPDFEFTMDVQEDLKDEGFTYDLISFNIKLGSLLEEFDSPVEKMMAELFLEKFLGKFQLYMHYADGLYYIVMGENGLDKLRTVVKEKGPGQKPSLADSATLAPYLIQIPETTDFIYQFSLARLYDLLAVNPDLPFDPLYLEDAPGLISTMDFTENHLQGTLFWGIDEMSQIITTLLQVITQTASALSI